jgi:hypothetical protein
MKTRGGKDKSMTAERQPPETESDPSPAALPGDYFIMPFSL